MAGLMDTTFYADYETWLDTLAARGTCPDCGQPRDSYRQQRRNGTADVIETCRNKACDLYSVTLDVRTWQTITGEQLEAYRQMVRKTRAGAA